MNTRQTAAARQWPDPCSCRHTDDAHHQRTGRCLGIDSYGLPCQCPSFEHDVNTDEHEDDDFNEFDPDNEQRGQP
jgi:hypothetical protein